MGECGTTVCERKGNDLKRCKEFTVKPRSKSGLDCLTCAQFALQQSSSSSARFKSSPAGCEGLRARGGGLECVLLLRLLR